MRLSFSSRSPDSGAARLEALLSSAATPQDKLQNPPSSASPPPQPGCSDATKLAELTRTREVSPIEVMQAHLDRRGRVEISQRKQKRQYSVETGWISAWCAIYSRGFDRHCQRADPTWNAYFQRTHTRHRCGHRCAHEESRGHSVCEDQSS